jgi:hypothetical protein
MLYVVDTDQGSAFSRGENGALMQHPLEELDDLEQTGSRSSLAFASDEKAEVDFSRGFAEDDPHRERTMAIQEALDLAASAGTPPADTEDRKRYAMTLVVAGPDENTAWEAIPGHLADGCFVVYCSNGWEVPAVADGGAYATQRIELLVQPVDGPDELLGLDAEDTALGADEQS